MYMKVFETFLEKLSSVTICHDRLVFVQEHHSMTCLKLKHRHFRFTPNLRYMVVALLACEP